MKFQDTFKGLTMIRAVHVRANNDHSLLVTLEDGRLIIFDMGFIKNLSGPVVEPLKDIAEFRKVFVRNGIVTWTTGYDIDPYYLVDSGKIVNKTA